MNTAAVRAWERRQSFTSNDISDKNNRKRRRRRRPGYNKDCTSTDIAVETRKSQSQHISETPSHNTNNSKYPGHNRTTSRDLEQAPSHSTSNLPNITVQISQHSSLDRDLYVAYQSSLSAQGHSSSLQSHPDSGLGEPAPPATSLSYSHGIVPDSQSLPGSSSYQPTSSPSLAVLGADHSPLIHQSCISSNNTDLESSTVEVVEANDSIEDSSAVVVAASQPSVIASERSKSEPAPNPKLSSSVLSCKYPSLPHSTSDPTSAYHDQQRRRASEQPSDHHTLFDQGIQSSAAFQVPHQRGERHTQQRQRSSEVQVPGSANPSVPTAVSEIDERESRHRSPASRISATPEDQIDNSHLSQATTTERESRHRSTASGILAISEDPTDNSHPSQATTTDDSILSLRDPNSQSTRQTHLAPSKESITYLENPIEDSTRTERSPKEGITYLKNPIEDSTRTDSSPVLASRVPLPDTLDSREPPLPPSSSEDIMSDTAPNDNGLLEGMQPLRMRATLKRIREDGEAKRVAARSGKRQHSESSTPRASPSLSRDDSEGPKMTTTAGPSPLLPYQPEESHLSRPTHSIAGLPPAVTRDELHVRVQSPIAPQSLRSTVSPSIIPAKAPYQVQEEPERLEVQPSMILKEISLPPRNPQSAPHTPTTPSKLSMHKEASPLQSQTTTLRARNLGPREFVVTLPMQPRILSQYVDTIEYYPQAIGRAMTEQTIGEDIVERLNTLLYRLGNVATHIGLEGGGPSSQEEVNPEEEALYAELSSEKFKFLGHLLALTKESQMHIAVVAKPGHLLDILEMFLKGKNVSYSRPDTNTNGLNPEDPRSFGLQTVSIVSSVEPIPLPPVQLIIAFDESFSAKDNRITKWRQSKASGDELTPVIRLVVYSSVEHLDLCLARSLEPIDRIRKLTFCVWHTQRSVGQLEPDEPDPPACAHEVAKFLNSGSNTSAWTLANIRPIENLPIMDSDSSLSDARSDISDIFKPEGAPKYYPNPVLPFITNPNNPNALPRARRPFVSSAIVETMCTIQVADHLQDLEYGDSLETQAKKRKMLADHNAGRLNNPVNT